MEKNCSSQMQSEVKLNKTSFLYKSLRRLYIFAQFIGAASFSYSFEGGVRMTSFHSITFLVSSLFGFTLIGINLTTELTIDVKGYQAILFQVGMRRFITYVPLVVWTIKFILLLNRNKIATLMEEIMALHREVKH